MTKSLNDIGVYRITHIESGRYYIGSSKHISVRFGQHRSALDLGRHHSAYLQSLWLKHGADAFSFDVVERHKTWDAALDSEQCHLDANFKSEKCLNMSCKARMPVLSPDVMRRARETANTSLVYIQSHRDTCLKRNADPVFQAKATAAIRNSQKHKEATRKNATTILQRPDVYEKCRASLSVSVVQKEAARLQAAKMNADPEIRAKNLAITSKPVVGIHSETGEIIRFSSQSAAARHLGVSSSNISMCCSGLMSTVRGYRWVMELRKK